MSDDLIDKLGAFGERLRVSGAEVGRKMSAGMNSLSFKMREILQGQNMTEKIVHEATSESMESPDMSLNIEICELTNSGRVNAAELIRAIKKQIVSNSPRVQYFALVLVDTCVRNCCSALSEIAAQSALDEMVKLVDDHRTAEIIRNKALILIKEWGESNDKLQNFPVFEQTFKNLSSRGVHFPRQDDASVVLMFTEARGVLEAKSFSNPSAQVYQQHPYTPQQINETIDFARNRIELLSAVLSSSPQNEALEGDVVGTLVKQCRGCQHQILQILENSGDDEGVLFDALNVNDDLQKVLSDCELLKMTSALQSEEQPQISETNVVLCRD